MTEDAHCLDNGCTDNGFTQSSDQPFDGRSRSEIIEITEMDKPSCQHQCPGRGIDEKRIALANVFFPVPCAQLVPDQVVSGMAIRNTQQGLRQTHEDNPLFTGEGVLMEECINPSEI